MGMAMGSITGALSVPGKSPSGKSSLIESEWKFESTGYA